MMVSAFVAFWRRVATVVAVALLTAGTPAWAHKSSDAYLNLQSTPTGAQLRVDVALRDLDRDLELDTDGNGAITWGEVKARWGDIDRLLRRAVVLNASPTACAVRMTGSPMLENHSDGAYAVLTYQYDCPAVAADQALSLQYTLFQQTDADHRGLLRWQAASGPAASMVLVPSAAARGLGAFSVTAIATGAAPAASAAAGGNADPSHAAPETFTDFVLEGARHISVGLDHVLFIVTLMLVVVLQRAGAGWVVQPSRGAIVREAFKVITAFTLTHSITLALAAAGVLSPPTRWVESIIALSVLITALDNIKPLLSLPRWSMAALFGIFHGFGFAGPLQDLGLRGLDLALPLLGFNLGVELGQLAIAAVALPLMLVRRLAAYRRVVMPLLSIGVAVLALVWLIERSLDIALLGP